MRGSSGPQSKRFNRYGCSETSAALPTTSKGVALLGRVSRRPYLQATALHQANPVRRPMLARPLPFACTAAALAHWRHLPRGRRSSLHFAGMFRLLHGCPTKSDLRTRTLTLRATVRRPTPQRLSGRSRSGRKLVRSISNVNMRENLLRL